MISHELTKELEKAGFPYDFWESKIDIGSYTAPDLSKLIESCGEGFVNLTKEKNGAWSCYSYEKGPIEYWGSGNTPEIATSRLWLALNKK